MRIAIFSDTFPPQINGVANTVRQFARSLTELGHQVRVFTVSKRGNKFASATIPDQFDVVTLPSVSFPLYPGERFGLPLGLASRRVKKFQPHIIHSHTPFSMGWEAVWAAKLLDLPLVGTHHTFYDYYLKHIRLDYRWAKKPSWKYVVAYYNRCDAVLSPTLSLAKEMQAHGLKKPISLMPNPVDTDLFRPQTAKHPGPVQGYALVYMGRVSAEKSIDQVLRAVALATKRRPQINLTIVGDGPERENLENLARQLGIADKVKFLGFRHGTELVKALQAGNIFITASKSENMPISLLEAMASGLPVIAVRALGIPEIVQHEVNGFLTPPDDLSAMAEKILELGGDSRLREEFSAASRQLALNHSQARTAHLLQTVYETLIHAV